MKNPINQETLQKLRSIVTDGPVLILTHDNPDPDALASGMALKTFLITLWGVPSRLIYSGVVARAENRAMLELLTPDWEHNDHLTELDHYSAIALVDSQPGAGNNRLPDDRPPEIVIDHHLPIQEDMSHVKFADLRPDIGSTVSMLYQYFATAGLNPETNLATAMFYGLHTDTNGLVRSVSSVDEKAYFSLLKLIDRDKLLMVQQAGRSREYFRGLSDGLQAAYLYGKAVIADLGTMRHPDMAAELADVLIRLESARAVLCFGVHENTLYFSLRTKGMDVDAGLIARAIAAGDGKAGGHGAIAGGQVPLEQHNPAKLVEMLKGRLLSMLDEENQGEPLLDPSG